MQPPRQRRGRTTNAQRPPDAHAARVLLIRSPEGGPVLPHGGGQALPGKAPVVMAERIGAFLAENPRAAPVRWARLNVRALIRSARHFMMAITRGPDQAMGATHRLTCPCGSQLLASSAMGACSPPTHIACSRAAPLTLLATILHPRQCDGSHGVTIN
jgi:hypothetical protein